MVPSAESCTIVRALHNFNFIFISFMPITTAAEVAFEEEVAAV